MELEKKPRNTNKYPARGRYPDDTEITSILFKQAIEQEKKDMVIMQRLRGQITDLIVELKNPVITTRARRNMQGWLELRKKELKQLRIKYNER